MKQLLSSLAPIPAVLLRAWLLALPVSSVAIAAMEPPAADEAPELGAQPIASKRGEEVFRAAIEQLESGQGAYSQGLAEQLLSLGQRLQQQGQHGEAVTLFRRGVHLSRINNGLYSPTQVPLLQREIASHMALGQFSEADERQRYLYRVQMRSMDGGLPRAQVFMQQAAWQYNAYRLALDGPDFPRLMNMWDLNRLALNDIVDREGQTSSSLLKPLHGMLKAQYLIADYNYGNLAGANSSDSFSAQQEENRFHAYRSQAYKKGRAVLQAMYDVQQANHGENSLETAEALTMLGDWVMWHGDRDTATLVYQDAIAELVARGDAQQDVERVFGEPVELPNYEGVSRLPVAVSADEGESQLRVSFAVTSHGKVDNFERVDDNELDSGPANRVMRKLRKTLFRPQLAAGEPVRTESVTRAYEIN